MKDRATTARESFLSGLVSALFLLALLFSPLLVMAEEPTATPEPSNLEKINEQVARQNLELQEASQRYQDADRALKNLGVEVSQMKKRETALVQETEALKAEHGRLEGEHRSAEARIVEVRDLGLRRLRRYYTHGSSGMLEQVVFHHGSSQDSGRMLYYLGRLSDFDRELLGRLHSLITDNKKRREELRALSDKQSRVLKALGDQRRALEQKLRSQKQLAAKLLEEKAAIEEVLTSLKAQALRLETVMVSITSGEERGSAGREASRSLMGSGEGSLQAFEGEGLFRQKGSLHSPVSGQVLQKYGRSQASAFEDFVFNKGIEFGTGAVSEVRVIADGQVLFSGRMPAYGNVVIIDHGQRYYSLYGRLGESKVSRGQIVSKGAVLGSTSAPDAKSRNLYFEIRRNGSAVDPADYFKHF